jgi:hypothetical protein
MKIKSTTFLLISFLFGSLCAQDIPLFEHVSNESLGITPVYIPRWGACVSDFNRDGWPDVYNAKWRGTEPSQIYMNNNGTFTNIMSNSPDLIEAEVNGNYNRTPVFVDYDNDGDRDLCLGTYYNIFMFRNDNNVFVDITDQLGIVSGIPGFVSIYGYEMSAWIDWDLDGDLDALVVQTNNPDYIFYRNDGDQFVDISSEVGLTGMNEMGERTDRGYHTGRLQWVDWDNDGDPDLSAGWKLFRNENGYLNEVSQAVGFLPYQEIRFCDWFDYDNDGDLDFILQGYGNRDELWKNENGTFVDATQETTLDLFVKPAQVSLNIGDVDNDGDLDVFVQINDWTGDDIEALLLNDESEPGVRSFFDVAQFANLMQTGDRKGSTLLDYDMDGKLDIFISSVEYNSIIYHNIGTETPNNWIGFDLWGTKSNKDAIGSWISLYAGGQKQVRYTKAATTWRLQDKPFAHFGIGQATAVDSVVIRWPMGDVEVFTDLAINQYHKIIELVGTAVGNDEAKNPRNPSTFQLAQNYPNPFNPKTNIDYEILRNSDVKLEIYDILGHYIATLVDEYQDVGKYKTSWDGRNDKGNRVPGGLYFYKLATGDVMLTKKMILLQ